MADLAQFCDRVLGHTHGLGPHSQIAAPLATVGSVLLALGVDGLADRWLRSLTDDEHPTTTLTTLLTLSCPDGTLGPLLVDESCDQAVTRIAATIADHGVDTVARLDTHTDLLGTLYGSARSMSGASRHGAFFTPVSIAGLVTAMQSPQPGDRISDPACGTGVMLRTAARDLTRRGIPASACRFVGGDLDAVAVACAWINLTAAGATDVVLTVRDALKETA